jgi:hypothetical protein
MFVAETCSLQACLPVHVAIRHLINLHADSSRVVV